MAKILTLQQRWAAREHAKTRKCHACRSVLKGPYIKVGELARCFWCNKRITGG